MHQGQLSSPSSAWFTEEFGDVFLSLGGVAGCVVGGTAAQAVSHLMVLQFGSAQASSHKDTASCLRGE